MRRTKEKDKCNRSLTERFVSGTPEDHSMNENGIFTNVNPESRGAPTTNCLNGCEIRSCFSKGSRTT